MWWHQTKEVVEFNFSINSVPLKFVFKIPINILYKKLFLNLKGLPLLDNNNEAKIAKAVLSTIKDYDISTNNSKP